METDRSAVAVDGAKMIAVKATGGEPLPSAKPKKFVPRKSSAERQAQILKELAWLLAAPGAPKASTSELAKRVGVTEPALYRHFEGKAQMLSALLDSASRSVEAIEQSGAGAVVAAMAFMEANPAMARLLAGDGLCGEDGALQARSAQIWAQLRAKIGGSPECSQAVCDWMRGAVCRWLTSDRLATVSGCSATAFALKGLCGFDIPKIELAALGGAPG